MVVSGCTSHASPGRISGVHLLVLVLKVFEESAAGTSRDFRGWLERFSPEQNAITYRIFEDYHSNPWERVIDSLWKAIIEHVVENAWLSLHSATVLVPPEIIEL